jgi:hypothetical protein
MIKGGVIAAVILTVLIPLFSPVFAQNTGAVPENLSEAQIRGESVLNAIPGVLTRLWGEFKVYLSRLSSWLYNNVWLRYIWPWIRNFWYREIEPRKPGVEQEFQKEKTEMGQDIKTEVPKITKSLWERFKKLIW